VPVSFLRHQKGMTEVKREVDHPHERERDLDPSQETGREAEVGVERDIIADIGIDRRLSLRMKRRLKSAENVDESDAAVAKRKILATSALQMKSMKTKEIRWVSNDLGPLLHPSRNAQATEVVEIEISTGRETARVIESTNPRPPNTAHTAPATTTDREAEIETGIGIGIVIGTVSTDTATPVTTQKKPPSDPKHPIKNLKIPSKRSTPPADLRISPTARTALKSKAPAPAARAQSMISPSPYPLDPVKTASQPQHQELIARKKRTDRATAGTTTPLAPLATNPPAQAAPLTKRKTLPKTRPNRRPRLHQQSKTPTNSNVKPEIVSVYSKKRNVSQAWGWTESGAEMMVRTLAAGRGGKRDDEVGLLWKATRPRRRGLRGWRLRGRARDGDNLLLFLSSIFSCGNHCLEIHITEREQKGNKTLF